MHVTAAMVGAAHRGIERCEHPVRVLAINPHVPVEVRLEHVRFIEGVPGSSAIEAGPTNGAARLSSMSPGCSPTMITRAVGGPAPNTVWVACSCRWHPVQSRAAARSTARSVESGTNGAAVGCSTSKTYPLHRGPNPPADRDRVGQRIRQRVDHRGPQQAQAHPHRRRRRNPEQRTRCDSESGITQHGDGQRLVRHRDPQIDPAAPEGFDTPIPKCPEDPLSPPFVFLPCEINVRGGGWVRPHLEYEPL